MLEQFRHAMLPEPTQDEASRQEYVYSLGAFIQNEVNPGLRDAYDKRVLPNYLARESCEPSNRHEVRKAMQEDFFYQLASSMQRTTQEMMWNAVDETIQRLRPQLEASARQAIQSPVYGSLRLDPDFEMPRYIANNDNHAMPGGYSADLSDSDISAGALYDRGGFIYTQGLFGSKMDGLGRAAINFVRRFYPELTPRRILDMGCTSGGPAVALHEAWPQAQTHAIDVGAALLRYAHARAESMGAAVHFSQQSAERTDFEAASFDLITCIAVLHETSRPAVSNIFAEAYRLLRPGGLFLISELPPYLESEGAYELFARDWDTWNNNEPFWGPVHDLDLNAMLVDSGFPPAGVVDRFAAGVAAANELQDQVPVENENFVGSTRGGGQAWYVAARK